MKCALFFAFGLLPFTWLCGGSLDWDAATPGGLPPGWICDGKGEGKVLASFGGEKHPVVEMESTGDSLALYNYKLASSYKPETLGRCKIQFSDFCVGCANFAMDGGGGRGGCGVYFTDTGTLEVGDERGARTRLLNEYKPGVWYEIRAYFSMAEETWDAEVIESDTGKTRSFLKGLGWACPAVRLEKACAGMALCVWSPGTVYVSEAEIKPLPAEVAAKRKAAWPLLGVPMTTRPPQIDGTLGKDEWTEAAHIGSLCVLNTGAMDPKPCDVYITYDEKNLYLAYHQPLRNSREVQPSYTKRDRSYTFFLQVSPVKPLPIGHESWRTGKDFAWPWFYVFNDALTQPMVHRPDFLPHVRAEHERGCAVLPYFFPTSMKATARDCLAYKNEWGHPGDLPDVLAEQNMPPDMKMNIDTSWTDYFMAGLDDFARDFGIDGVYYDTTGPMRRSVTDENGERHTFWPLLGCREFHRRTAVIFEKRRGPGNYILFNHMSDNMVMPTLSLFTIAFDGEQYNRVPPNCADYTALLPFERAEVIDNPEHWGFPCQFLPEIPIRKTPEARRTNRLATDSLLAMLLPLGNSWWGEGPMLYERQKQVADAMEKFGVAEAAFHPYWRQKEIVAPDGVVVTYYEKTARRLVIVSNPGPERRSGTIKVTDRAPATCADALGETAPALTGGELRIEMAPHTFRLLIMEMASAAGSKSQSP